MTREEIRRLLPLQAGGLLGPMGGTGMITLIPALSDGFEVAIGVMAMAITVYMLAFALVQLFSGALSQRVGGRRIALVGFALYAAASLVCAVAPDFLVFLSARVLQGVGGAFLFPVMLALVGEAVVPARLGRAVGAFGVTQTLGLTLGPVVAGLCQVHLGWRWFFAMLAALATCAALGFLTFPRGLEPRPAGERILVIAARVLREPTVLLLSGAAAGLFFSMIGTYTYVAAWLRDTQGLPEDRIGILLGVAGMVGIPASALAGGWVDRFGRKVIGVAGLIAYVAATAALWAAPYSFAGFLVLSSALGWAGAVAWTALNTLAVEVMPALRKPVASVYNAFRFLGYAAAPPLLGILYAWQDAGAVYLVCGLVVIVAAGLMSRLPASRSAMGRGTL